MAGATLRVAVDVRDISDNLNAIAEGLDQPIRDVLGFGAADIAKTARELMRERPAGSWKGSSGSRYSHIRDYYSSRVNRLSAVVESAHPAAPVWEWGGTIHPLLGAGVHHVLSRSSGKEAAKQVLSASGRDRPPWTFVIPGIHPVGAAGDEHKDSIASDLDEAVSALVEKHGF